MINCHYCARPCRKVNKMTLVNSATYWQCDYHGAVVVRYLLAVDHHIDDLNWRTIILVCRWKDETYHVVFILNTSEPIKFRIDKILPHKFMRPELAEAIVTLNFLPEDITPENVMNKLPTYLLFS